MYVSIDKQPLEFFKLIISEKPTKYVEQELKTLTNMHGKDIVNEAIKRLADIRTTNYIATIVGIIKNWKEQGMTSFEDIERVETEYTEKQKKKRRTVPQKQNTKKAGRKEIVPSWLKEEIKNEQDLKTEEPTTLEADRKRLEAVLKRYKQA